MECELLLKKAAKGDTDAFAEIAESIEPKIYGLCLRMLKNTADAADAAEEALVRIWRALPRFKGRSAFSTWVYTIARNTCLDIIRRTPAVVDIDEMVGAADDGESPEEEALRQERCRTVRRAIDELAPDQREMIIMRDIEERSYREIAELTGLEEGTVKSRIFRARQKLKQRLTELGVM